MNKRILCVDDDAMTLHALKCDLGSAFEVSTALDGEEALGKIAKETFAVLVADMVMPGMDGVEVLSHAQTVAPETTRIMLTGNQDIQTAIDAINEGHIFRFLTKPYAPDRLVQAVQAGVEQYRLVTCERELLERTVSGSVNMLSEVLSLENPAVFGRGRKLKEYVRLTATAIGIDQKWDIEVAAMLGQIGLVTVPAKTMQRAESNLPLNPSEREMLKRVSETGSKILSHIPRLEPAAAIIRYLDKNFDGTGMPADGVAGDRIPLGARLLRILTDIVQLEHKGMSTDASLAVLRQKAGCYDSRLLDQVASALNCSLSSVQSEAIHLRQLTAGRQLLAPLETSDGMLIAPAGTIISPTMLERILNFSELISISEPIHVKRLPDSLG